MNDADTMGFSGSKDQALLTIEERAELNRLL